MKNVFLQIALFAAPSIWILNILLPVWSLAKYNKNYAAHFILLGIVLIYGLLLFAKTYSLLDIYKKSEHAKFKTLLRYELIFASINTLLGLLIFSMAGYRLFIERTPLFD